MQLNSNSPEAGSPERRIRVLTSNDRRSHAAVIQEILARPPGFAPDDPEVDPTPEAKPPSDEAQTAD